MARTPDQFSSSPAPRRKKFAALTGGILLASSLLAACGTSSADEVPMTVTSTVTTVSSTTKTTTATTTVTATTTETVTEEPVSAEDIDVSGAGAEVDTHVEDNTPIVAGFVDIPEPVPAPAPAPVQQQNTYYKNCTAARAAGAAPVYAGNPGYGSHLDRDGDGVGCE